jgi:hypothetical protein
MKYYKIESSTGKDVGNVFPQIGFINQQDAFKLEFDEFISIPTLIARLERKAKITDVLSEVSIFGRGILVNEKVKSIIDNFDIGIHKYYDVILNTKKENISYYWLHLMSTDTSKMINYKKSVFYWGNPLRKGILNLDSYEDYLNKEEENKDNVSWMVSIDEIVLLKECNVNLDLFCFREFVTPKELFISERLKNALIENKITGIEITEAPISFG